MHQTTVEWISKYISDKISEKNLHKNFDKASGRINHGKFGRLTEILLEKAQKKTTQGGKFFTKISPKGNPWEAYEGDPGEFLEEVFGRIPKWTLPSPT